MSDKMPQGWRTASLAEVLIALESGSRPRGGVRGIAQGVPSIGGEHLNYNGGFNFDSIKYVPKEFAAAMTKGRIQRNDILVVKDGATTGKTAFIDDRFPFDQAFVNEHVFICRPVKEIEPQFLFRFLTSKDGQERILENFKGSAQGGINQAFAPNTEVPLAPLPEQRRIVAKLEKLLGQVDACLQRLVEIPALLKRFRQSVLAAACSGRLTADWREENVNLTSDVENELPSDWQHSVVGDVIESLKYGTAQKCSPEKLGVPVLRIPNIVDGIISHSDLKYAELPEKEFQQLRLRPGDVLLIRSNGSVSLVGKCALVRKVESDFAYAGYLIRLRPDTKKVLPEFLNLVLGSYGVRTQIEIPARSTSGVNNINSEEVRALSFSLPLLPEQQEIVRRVESLFALGDQIEARLAKARGQVDKLTPSLLARAFAGKLVPQDPNDEPASALLERIKMTRAKT
ncbi:MAG: restriction endonuclease subunit S [Verrucomicrobiota bacterium]|jgi:type I restriction enzyme S subunit